jgi:hypothetical protein
VDPDPHNFLGTWIRIRIRIKVTRIRNKVMRIRNTVSLFLK